MEERVILNRLLDRFERSSHLTDPGRSDRRVLLRIDRKELPEYRYDESAEIRDAYNRAALNLQERGLLTVEWARSMRMQTLALNLERVWDAYRLCERIHPAERAKIFMDIVEEGLEAPGCLWIADWKREVCNRAGLTYKLPAFCAEDFGLLKKLVKALAVFDSLNGAPVSMRAFSIACFHDSKTFERECRNEFLKIALRYDTELRILCEEEKEREQELTQREQLAFLGIEVRPELYELAGNCRIATGSGILDLHAAGKSGLAISGRLVEEIRKFDLREIRTVTFIENKTSYDEYLKTEMGPEELVLYHGGFLSPQKRKLYTILADAVTAVGRCDVRLWSDIDLGGFRMFEKLRKIFPTLTPMRMGVEEVIRFHSCGLKRSEAYLDMLKKASETNVFPVFSEAITQILKYGVTVEQEVFLSENCG